MGEKYDDNLRDMFAAAAMNSTIAEAGVASIDEIADRCYRLADAMMARRQERDPEPDAE
ncbi:MAG: hypothetical protein ACR2QS_00330 [Woeseiaceae bacterium]